jgi:hypothetical protein
MQVEAEPEPFEILSKPQTNEIDTNPKEKQIINDLNTAYKTIKAKTAA